MTNAILSLRPPLPGLVVAMGLATAAMALRTLPGGTVLSPAILAILLGIGARQAVGMPHALRPGLAIALRSLLRLAVMLLGVQVTLSQIAALGLGVVGAVAGGLVCCFVGTLWLGKLFNVEPRLARLIAAGTAVCGASAVIAVNSVVRGDDEDVAYAVASVTVFGTIAMLATPAVAVMLGMDGGTAGLWIGASLHEVAQVVGAASQLGEHGMQVATTAKMARILMLAPLVFSLVALGPKREASTAKVPVPWFVFGFLALAALRSLGMVPVTILPVVGQISGFLLATALAAMGFGIDPKQLWRRGPAPLALALSSWLLLAAVSRGLLAVLG